MCTSDSSFGMVVVKSSPIGVDGTTMVVACWIVEVIFFRSVFSLNAVVVFTRAQPKSKNTRKQNVYTKLGIFHEWSDPILIIIKLSRLNLNWCWCILMYLLGYICKGHTFRYVTSFMIFSPTSRIFRCTAHTHKHRHNQNETQLQTLFSALTQTNRHTDSSSSS